MKFFVKGFLGSEYWVEPEGWDVKWAYLIGSEPSILVAWDYWEILDGGGG